jgi:hypothetical protein
MKSLVKVSGIALDLLSQKYNHLEYQQKMEDNKKSCTRNKP